MASTRPARSPMAPRWETSPVSSGRRPGSAPSKPCPPMAYSGSSRSTAGVAHRSRRCSAFAFEGSLSEASRAMLRELRESDAEEVAGLFQTAYGDERPIDAEEIVSWANNSEVKTEWMRVLELDGRVVGYGDIMIEDDDVALDAAAPGGHWDIFFEWADEQARAE